jgi:hypothetical protein
MHSSHHRRKPSIHGGAGPSANTSKPRAPIASSLTSLVEVLPEQLVLDVDVPEVPDESGSEVNETKGPLE